MMDRYYTVTELADVTGLSRDRIERLIREGLPVKRFGRRGWRYVKRSDFESFVVPETGRYAWVGSLRRVG